MFYTVRFQFSLLDEPVNLGPDLPGIPILYPVLYQVHDTVNVLNLILEVLLP